MIIRTLNVFKYFPKMIPLAPKRTRYDTLEETGYGPLSGEKAVWLVYAYCRESGEIAAFMRGKRNLKRVRRLRHRLQRRVSGALRLA
jgi:hypothetical protein